MTIDVIMVIAKMYRDDLTRRWGAEWFLKCGGRELGMLPKVFDYFDS